MLKGLREVLFSRYSLLGASLGVAAAELYLTQKLSEANSVSLTDMLAVRLQNFSSEITNLFRSGGVPAYYCVKGIETCSNLIHNSEYSSLIISRAPRDLFAAVGLGTISGALGKIYKNKDKKVKTTSV